MEKYEILEAYREACELAKNAPTTTVTFNSNGKLVWHKYEAIDTLKRLADDLEDAGYVDAIDIADDVSANHSSWFSRFTDNKRSTYT